MNLELDEFLLPPGCKRDILRHPSQNDASVEIALFQDHRYAFFFWLRWSRHLLLESQGPPALISLDWHEDLAGPDATECDELLALNQDAPREVALFCWEKLNPLNDGHILAAAYLGFVGDIYVVRKQQDEPHHDFIDVTGREHRIRCFASIEALVAQVTTEEHRNVFFDIDLDFFAESSDPNGGGDSVTLVADADILAVLDPDGPLLEWIFPRLCGMTIATEPEFCGGVVNSNHVLSVVTSALFSPQLLSHRANWKHLAADD
jgi:hypothetical protein